MKILLLLDTRNDIRNDIIKELKILGYQVFAIPYNENFKLTFFQKIINLIYRFLFRSDQYLIKKKRDFVNYINKKEKQDLIKHSQYDFTLIFRADLIPEDKLKLYRSLSKKMIAYQWDGIERYPNFKSQIAFFDQIFCFDPSDEKLPTIKFLPNFYLKNIQTLSENKIAYDIIYIGYYYEDRYQLLEKIAKQYPNLKTKFILKTFTEEQDEIVNRANFLTHISKIYSYQEMIEEQSKSKIIFDIKHEAHDGLSFRFFEAMALKRKIITTNVSVKNYDFYSPNNILILEDDNFNEIATFINLPYQEISPDILAKYSFENWLNILINSDKQIDIANPLNIDYQYN